MLATYAAHAVLLDWVSVIVVMFSEVHKVIARFGPLFTDVNNKKAPAF